MNQEKFDLLKSHIDAFTRKDGRVVAAHDDKRQAAQPKAAPLATHADALRRSTKPGDLDQGKSDLGAHKVGDVVSYKGERGTRTRTGNVKGLRDGKVIVEHKAGYTELKHHSELSATGQSPKKYQVRDPSGNVTKVFHGESAEHEARQHIHKNQDKRLSLRDVTPK